MTLGVLTRWLLAITPFLALPIATAQQVKVTFGFDGQLVAEAWNPVRVTLRDVRQALLEIQIDQGSLREGRIPLVYRLPISGGSGVTHLEKDLFIPGWREFVWSLSSRGTILASGSFSQRNKDVRPLELILSSAPGRWRDLYPEEARTIEVDAPSLPERLAAYAGVHSILLDGTSAVPRAAALAAAAAAGVVVILLEPLPPSYQEIELLAASSQRALGMGWLISSDRQGLRKALERPAPPDDEMILEALDSADLVEFPRQLPQITLLIAGTGYALLTILLLRFGGAPGLLAGLSLALFLSLASWPLLRSPKSVFMWQRSVLMGAGELGKLIEVRVVFSLPGREVTVAGSARPLPVRSYTVNDEQLTLKLQRWKAQTLLSRPRLASTELRWEDGRLSNHGPAVLEDLYVKGLGPQGAIAPGSSLRPLATEEGSLPPPYEKLLPLLPNGTGVAHRGQRIQVALPPAKALAARGEP